jgi:hypothetical protein
MSAHRGQRPRCADQSMTIFGYRKASLIAGTRPACAQAVPCWSSAIGRLRNPRHEVGCLGWP